MKNISGCLTVCLQPGRAAFSQVDTLIIYNTNTPDRILDLRICKSAGEMQARQARADEFIHLRNKTRKQNLVKE